jgi:hypothetical protein
MTPWFAAIAKTKMPIAAIMPMRMYLPASGCGALDSVDELYKFKIVPFWIN